MAAERKPELEVVEMRRNNNTWNADRFVNRTAGIASWRATRSVLEVLARERRERREWITQMLFIAMGSAIAGAAVYKLLVFHLH